LSKPTPPRIGRNIKFLIDRQDEEYCFRLHRDKVFYVSAETMKRAVSVPRKQLLSLGTCFGKFTKSGKFRLHITCLDLLAQFALYKVWVKQSSEMSWLYGKHCLKAGLGRITEDTPRHAAVVVMSMNEIPLGFGVTAFSTAECRKLEPQSIVVYNQADTGEYLRDETTL
jgi:60S ribosome subunit biogenesis protein NIP7